MAERLRIHGARAHPSTWSPTTARPRTRLAALAGRGGAAPGSSEGRRSRPRRGARTGGRERSRPSRPPSDLWPSCATPTSREAEAAAVELAFQIAEKVIGGDASPPIPSAVLGVVVGRALAHDRPRPSGGRGEPGGLRARPRRRHRAGGAASAGSTASRSSPSAASSRGGCVVRTEEGEIDARIAAQIGRVRQLLGEVPAAGRAGRRRARRCLTPSRIGPWPPTRARSPRPTCSVTAAVSPT